MEFKKIDTSSKARIAATPPTYETTIRGWIAYILVSGAFRIRALQRRQMCSDSLHPPNAYFRTTAQYAGVFYDLMSLRWSDEVNVAHLTVETKFQLAFGLILFYFS